MAQNTDSDETARTGPYDWSGIWGGMRAALSLPGLVMACSFIGFGALINDLGFPLASGIATIALIWALPGQVLFVTMWEAGISLLVIAAAVSLTAVRLLPMVIGVLAQVRIPGAPRWPEYLLAYFTAVTIWVLSVTHLDNVPKNQHLPWLFGLGATLMTAMCFVVPAGYYMADLLPPVLAACMVFFTPAFFLLSLMASAKWRFDWAAVAAGIVLLPLARMAAPDFDLMLAGIGGGTLAFVLLRPRRKGLIGKGQPHE
jgi:predicted branched-subunit amino acid permease